MSEQSNQGRKKDFFELLDPKSALTVGLIGGFLSVGTIGFLVLGSMFLKGNVSFERTPVAVAETGNVPEVQQAVDTTPPANIPKTDKPKVELFVMSYCPYGLQMEKALMPAWDLLKNKADISVKFVSYIMHGKEEIDENTREYCIQKEQPSKFATYLKCFYAGVSGQAPDYKSCLTQAGVNTTQLNSCVSKTDKQFGITDKFNDQSTWLSGRYPLYPIHESDNSKYGVQGSPTLVINGVEAQVGRTPEAVKSAICAAFNNTPAECNNVLSNLSFQPGFGLAQGAAAGATDPGCGT